MFGLERIPELEADIEKLDSKRASVAARIRGLVRHGQSVSSKVDEYYRPHFESSVSHAQAVLAALPQHQYAGWVLEEWNLWEPPVWDAEDGPEARTPTLLRVGDYVETRGKLAGKYRVPAFLPFLGQNRTIIIQSHGAQNDDALALFQSLLIRSALMLPHQVTFTLLDPAGNGAAFPMRRHLASVRENSGDARRDLERVIQDIQRINEFYLDALTPSFELVDAKLRINEKFQLVFAADFPNKYDRRAIEALQSVANTGPRTGTYVFIHHNRDVELPRDMSLAEFRNALYVDVGADVVHSSANLKLKLDGTPDPTLQDVILQRLRSARAPERKVGAELIVPSKEWWTESATQIISTPIGVSGASGTLGLWFGANDEGIVCAHGMLGAMTGSGKSNLYHVLILGLCTRYSPNELRLFLIDGKDGVEFQPYRDLPHADVVSLKSSPQLSRSVLAELVAERERRNRLFAEARVTDLTQYRNLGQPAGNLPRILLLVDEYQELFEGDKDGEASALLLQLAQQGRSAGIHMLLGSQRFGAPGMFNQTAIFGNVHLRMAMQMTSSDIQALTEFGRRGKQAIMHCDIPGKIVVNDRSGDDAGNKEGKVAYLGSEQRRQVIDKLIEMARELPAGENIRATVVFDGKAQPNLVENPYVAYLLRQPKWLPAAQFEKMARQPIYDGGLGVLDWFSAEHPRVIWVGQEFSVRGEASIIIRRRTSEHVMIIGGANAARYGMLAACMASIALNTSPDGVAFFVFDRSIAGTAWNHTLENVVDNILKPAGYLVEFKRDTKQANEVLDAILAEMDVRRTMDEESLGRKASLFAIMSDLDRVEELRRRADTYGMSESPLGQKLNRIVIEGPSLGVHLLLSFSGVRPMTHVLDERRTLQSFRHRVALQMSEDESLTFVRSRKAAQLQNEGPAPICALYLDLENDNALRFKPYSIEATIPFDTQIAEIGKQIVEWSDNS